MQTVLIAIGLVAVFFVLMSVRIIFLKNGQFKGTCANQSPFLKNQGATCGYCGKPANSCENEGGDNKTEVERVMDRA